MDADFNPALQHNVQRLLGRCLLRLQQYERLMKALLTEHELTASLPDAGGQPDARGQRYATKSLGQLAQALFDSYFVTDRVEPRRTEPDKAARNPPAVAFRFQVALPNDRWERTKLAVEELVDMRNALIHHFIERFNVWTPDGCADATKHLNRCYERIDAHLEELRQWAEEMGRMRAYTLSLMESDVVRDLVESGIKPDGSFDWQNTGAVSVLRDAAADLQRHGWTPLDAAKTWIARHHPEQAPAKYGCKSWKQVLHESKLFELKYETLDGHRRALYREKQPSARAHRETQPTA